MTEKSEERFQAPKCLSELVKDCPDELLLMEIKRRCKASDKAKADLLMQQYKALYTQRPELYLYKNLDQDIIPIVEENYRNGAYPWVTINMDDSKFDQVAVLKALTKKPFGYVRRWLAVIEYHTKGGNHPHIHMIIEKKPEFYTRANKSKVISDFYRRFREFITGDKEKIDCRMPKNPSSKVSYVKGVKAKEKKEHVDKDVEWRKKRGLLDVYGNWDQVGDLSSGNGLVGTQPNADVSGAPPSAPIPVPKSASSTKRVGRKDQDYWDQVIDYDFDDS